MLKQHFPMDNSLTPQWIIGAVFLFGGVLICVSLFSAWGLAVSFSGWGDGATGDAIKYSARQWVVFIAPLSIYFLAGFFASLSKKRSARVVLAWTAHVSLLFVMLNGTAALPALIIFIVIAALFAVCWGRLLRIPS